MVKENKVSKWLKNYGFFVGVFWVVLGLMNLMESLLFVVFGATSYLFLLGISEIVRLLHEINESMKQ